LPSLTNGLADYQRDELKTRSLEQQVSEFRSFAGLVKQQADLQRQIVDQATRLS
jgi:hypothetical protein